MSTPALEISRLHAWYGESHVLHGVNFDVREGEVLTCDSCGRLLYWDPAIVPPAPKP